MRFVARGSSSRHANPIHVSSIRHAITRTVDLVSRLVQVYEKQE
jgi:hypothetical protein